jgi:hypothetical protein
MSAPDLTSSMLETFAQLVAERLAGRPDLPRFALTKQEAARALGVSVDHLERHILPDLRVIRSGSGQRRLTLIPVRELERWTDVHAAYPLGGVA